MCKIINISKKDFELYNYIQDKGTYDMVMDANMIMHITGLTKEKYFFIIENYEQIKEKYKIK